MFRTDLCIVLASKSPRRRELIEQIDIPYRVVSIDVEETFPDGMPPKKVPEFLAVKKASAVSSLEKNEVLLTADTDVILNDNVLGKPKTKDQAKKMLQQLSNRNHKVITGICLKSNQKQIQFSVTSIVTFSKLTEEEINYYVNHFEVLDKAGAYGIQDWIGKTAIKEIKGDFYNIVGLPLSTIFRKLNTHF